MLAELEKLDARKFLVDSAVTELDASLAGHRFGSYTLIREIGHGGTGTVWLAKRSDGRFEGEAAVKLLNTALVGHPSSRRFAREGSVLARLRHPNIAHLLDAGVAAGSQPYLVLEYVRGRAIDRFCAEQNLSIEQRIRLFLDVLSAVTHAHNSLIVHRDLKPSNILVTDEGVVKLLDFGIAALLSPTVAFSTHVTRHVLPGLTPGYAAPEQLLGKTVTTATDVFALGIVLFRLLADCHPFDDEERSTAELMRLTLDTDAPRASDVATEPGRKRSLRGDLDNIIAMALHRNPLERYATADLLAQDLRRYLAFEPVSARSRSAFYLTRMFMRRHRGAVASAFAIAVILVAAIVLTTGQMLDAREQRDRATAASRQAEATKDFLELLMMTDLGPTHPMQSLYDRIESGVKVLEREYQDDPRFKGRMLAELGAGYSGNEQTKRANELFQRAYDLGRAENDVELMVNAQCARAYGEASADIDEGVKERLEEARRLLGQLERPDADLQTACLAAQAVFELRLGHSQEAEALLFRAKRILEDDGATHRQIYTTLLNELGQIYIQRNQPRELLRMMQLIGEIHDRNGRGSTSNRMITRQNAASALTAMGEARVALAQRQEINRYLQRQGNPDDEPPVMRVNYAAALIRMGRSQEARELLDELLGPIRSAGNVSSLTLTLFHRGSALVQLKRWDEAEASLQEAATLAATGLGNRNMSGQVAGALARIALARGNLAAARKHREEALGFAGYRTEKTQRGLWRVLLISAEVALAERAPGNAEQFARQSLAIVESNARTNDSSADVGEALLRVAQAQIALGAQEEARPMLERAVRCLTNGLGPEHALTAEARAALAAARA